MREEVARSVFGVLGVVGSVALTHVATFGACLASFATAFYMGLCALEKWRALRDRRPRR